jgi:putative flippase GtrA
VPNCKLQNHLPPPQKRVAFLGRKVGLVGFLSLVREFIFLFRAHLISLSQIAGDAASRNSILNYVIHKLYTMRTKMFRHPSWVMKTVHLRHQSIYLSVCAWLMFSSVLAKRSQTLTRNPLLKKLSHVSSVLLRYFSY